MLMTAGELAVRLGGELEGDPEVALQGVATAGAAGNHDLIYVESEKQLDAARVSAAAVVLAGGGAELPGKTVIRVTNSKLAFAHAIEMLLPEPRVVSGVHPAAIIDSTAELGEAVAVGPCAVIGARARIGARTQIGPGCVIGEDAVAGEDCVLFARVTLYRGARLGNRVRVHAGTVIGSDGFGYVPTEEEWVKFPQRGTVVIEDDVEIGANTVVDRGALGETRIGQGVKLDNLVQVAHNVQIGSHTVIAAQSGVAGSSTIGRHVVVGGQSGVADHCTVGDGAVVAAKTAVSAGKKVRPGETVFGNPARPLEEFKKSFPYLARLPQLAARIAALEKKKKG